jgi:hypothetical protein
VSVGDGDGQADTAQGRLCMGRHIVSSFQRMHILWPILRDKAVEDDFHIYTNIWICILIDAQSAARMLAEYVDDTGLRQFWQLTHYLACHQMKASWLGRKYYLYLLNHSFVSFYFGTKLLKKPQIRHLFK